MLSWLVVRQKVARLIGTFAVHRGVYECLQLCYPILERLDLFPMAIFHVVQHPFHRLGDLTHTHKYLPRGALG